MARVPRVALVYDRVNSWGGAERVLQQLHTLFPDAPLFTSVYEPTKAGWAQGWDVRTSFLQHIPFLRTRHQLVGWLMPIVFEQFDLSEFDVVISVSSEFAKSVVTKPNQLHICYLLTPTRYLWSHRDQYASELPLPLSWLAQMMFSFLRKYDYVAASRPDEYIVLSQLVADRCEQYYGRKPIEIIAPPLTPWVSPEKPLQKLPEKYLISWGRLVGYKQFDLLLTTAIDHKMPVVFIGDGPARSKLEALARRRDPQGQYVRFFGALTESQLHWCVAHAQAAVFPQIEDFGISILEACLVGCPVVAQRKSGASELLEERDGVFFLDGENSEELAKALQKAWAFSGNRLDIRRQARQYAGVQFVEHWQKVLEERHEQITWRFSPAKARKGL